MKAIVSCLAAVVIAVLPPIARAAGSDTTARAVLKEATAAAKKWQADATLISVSTLQASPEGKAPKWSHMFYSAKANKGYVVELAGSKVVDTLEVRPHVTDPVALDFIDSDKAMAAAKANGVDTKGKPYSMTLRLTGKNTKRPFTGWLVGGGFSKGAVAVALDAKTGKLEFRQEIP